MSEWAPRRFYETATATEVDDGHGIALDGRRVMTPGKSPLVVPTRGLVSADFHFCCKTARKPYALQPTWHSKDDLLEAFQSCLAMAFTWGGVQRDPSPDPSPCYRSDM